MSTPRALARMEDLFWLDEQGEDVEGVLRRTDFRTSNNLQTFCTSHDLGGLWARFMHRQSGDPSRGLPPRPEPSEELQRFMDARDSRPMEAGEFQWLDVDDLEADEQNLRESVGDVGDLAASMVDLGMLQPIVARRDGTRVVVVSGHRRLAAAQQLGWAEVPCIVRAEMRSDDVLAAMLVENGHRKDLDDIEVARGIARLRTQMAGCTHADLARKIGRSQAFVSERLALLNLNAEEQELVRAKRFKLTQAIARGRENAGHTKAVGRNGQPKAPSHLSRTHPLALDVMRRCANLGHSTSNSKSVGGSGCGQCWEEVIRADERAQFVAKSMEAGRCIVCDATYQREGVA